jgi:hypothetical protein
MNDFFPGSSGNTHESDIQLLRRLIAQYGFFREPAPAFRRKVFPDDGRNNIFYVFSLTHYVYVSSPVIEESILAVQDFPGTKLMLTCGNANDIGHAAI